MHKKQKGLDAYTGENYNLTILHSAFELVDAMLTGVIIAVVIFSFVIMRNSVSGTSMLPTLQDKDEIIVYHLFYQPKKGDIVIVNDPYEQGKHLVKRVIALEGDKLQIDFENSLIYVNNERLNEPYIYEQEMLRKPDWDIPEIIPENCVFIMGDNRNNSRDSRFSSVKLINKENILGKVMCVIWPFNRLGNPYNIA